MAENYDVNVVAIDLSVNMISIALERAIGRHCVVQFEFADCTKEDFPEGYFDDVYTRDTLLHIEDKPTLFKRMNKWLKPGGKILISDYCEVPSEPSPQFASYIKQRGYTLYDPEHYGRLLRDVGFEVIVEYRTSQFIDVLEREVASFQENKESFLMHFSEEDYNAIVSGWKSKMKRCTDGLL